MAATKRDWPLSILVVVTANATVPPHRVATVSSVFHGLKIPITVSVPAPGAVGPDAHDAAVGLLRTLRPLHDADKTLTEIAVDLGQIESEDPYFQLRQASDAQSDFTRFANLLHDPAIEPLLMALTATTATPLRSAQDMLAMRGAGIRTILHLAAGSSASGLWMRDNGMADITASSQHSVVTAGGGLRTPKDMRRNMEQAARTSDDPIVLEVPLQRLADLSDADLSAYVDEVAATIVRLDERRLILPELPRDLHARSRKEARRYVIVRADDYRGDPSKRAAYEQFISEVLGRGLSVSDAVIPVGAGILLTEDAEAQAHLRGLQDNERYEAALHGWTHAPDEFVGRTHDLYLRELRDGAAAMFLGTGRMPRTFIPPYNVMDAPALDAMADIGLSTVSAHRGNYAAIQGMDSRGLFRMSNVVAPEKAWTDDVPYLSRDELWRQLDTENDTVLMLHPFTMRDQNRRDLVMEVLQGVADDPRTVVTNFAGFEKAVLPAMPMLEQVRSTRSIVRVRDTIGAAGIIDEKQLKRDAEVAWTYLERGAAKYGEMAPATAWNDSGAFAGYPFVTMWDVGSYVYGLMAAHLIGLIDNDAFEQKVAGTLRFLDASYYTYKGAKLTEAERQLSSQPAARRGFNAADAGRLLLSLKALDTYSVGAFAIKAQVEKWDFRPALMDGVMHDITRGVPKPVDSGYFAAYPRNGFVAWGHEVKALYDDAGVGRDMDATIRFLEDVMRRGRIATEPYALEEIEIGETPGTKTIVDFMHAAQIRRHEETGILTCASEGPVDGAPFFTYQGYQLTPTGGEWVVDEVVASQRADIAARGDRIRLVSTKGCFLWAALRPGTYSDRLIAAAREAAVIDGVGFASGIYETNGNPTRQSDLNTNGIILEAIAFMLKDRVPLTQFSPLAGLSATECPQPA